MTPSTHLDLDDPRYLDAEAAIEAWRDTLSAHRRHLVLVVVALFLAAVFVASLLV